MAKMGLQFGLNGNASFCKRQFRWLFEIPGICADETAVNALPPQSSARPNIGFKEMEVQHLIEDVYYPCKPDWKPISIVLYDLQRSQHPVFGWLQELYIPNEGSFVAPNTNELIKTATLKMLNGCGEIVEQWVFEDAWPQSVNFQTLDMCSCGIVTCEISLRYARAYIEA